MELAQEAAVERERGNLDRARFLSADALPLEIAAAGQVTKSRESEPTRSILYLSAATLAYYAGDPIQARQLIGEGLAGYPPPRVEHDLYTLLQNLGVSIDLIARGDALRGSQIQIAIEGVGVGYGQIPYHAFEDRARAAVGILQRTAMREQGQPYVRSMGAVRNRAYTPVISTPTPGSFRVVLELVRRNDTQLSYLPSEEAIVEEVVAGVGLIQNGELDQLRERISDSSYYANFVLLAQQLAPDGEIVSAVELSSSKSAVSFTTKRRSIEVPRVAGPPPGTDVPAAETFRLRGTLIEASVRNDKFVMLKPERKKATKLWVPDAIDDLVRSYFDREVEVRVVMRQGRLELINFFPVES